MPKLLLPAFALNNLLRKVLVTAPTRTLTLKKGKAKKKGEKYSTELEQKLKYL